MAVTPINIYRGTAPTTLTTVYTVPTGKKVIIKNIIVTSVSSAEGYINIQAGGKSVLSKVVIKPRDVMVLDLSLVLEAGETISVNQQYANFLDVHISGVEVA